MHENGSTEIWVSLSDDPEREVVIPITSTLLGGASTGDHSSLPESVTFSRMDYCLENEPAECYESSKSFTFRAAADADDDGEAVRLAFGAPLPAGVSVGRRATATVRINDGGVVLTGLAQVGVGVTAQLNQNLNTRGLSNLAWQWQRSATEFGAYSDIPAAEGGTSNPYVPAAGDLGMWLRAKVTYDRGSTTGRTTLGNVQRQVLSKPTVSNAGFINHSEIEWVYSEDESGHYRYAQGFTTGPHERGYRLTAVRLVLFVTAGHTADGAWGVHADDDGKPADAPLTAALPVLNEDIDNQPYTYEELTHPDGVHLDPNTKYWIVISQRSPNDDGIIGIGAWSEFAESLEVGLEAPPLDQGSEDGWSVDFDPLTYYYPDPDGISDEPHPVLHPWEPFGRGVEIEGKYVISISLVARVELPEVTVQFGAPDYAVPEGDDATTTDVTENEVGVTVTLSADPERTLNIPIESTELGGVSSADYGTLPTSVTFNSGETSKTITFTATDDALDDDDEGVKLSFGTMPDDRVTAGTTDETTVSITDDDDPFVTVEFGESAYTVAEGDDSSTTDVAENEAEVIVTLSADPERTVIIPIETEHLGEATSADYSSLPTSVTFSSGETSKTITFTATDDTVDDDDESVRLSFGTMPDPRVSAGATDVATVSITDNDDPEVTVQFGQASQGVGEGETVMVAVRLSADPERTVTIPVTSSGQGGATSSDYSVPTSVTFNDGETEKTIAFTAANDEADDDDESVKLGFGSSLPSRVTAGTRAETTLNIGDDDDPEVEVQFGAGAYMVAESDDATTSNLTENEVVVTVTLDKDPERTIIIPITSTLVGTASAADYEGVPPSVTFNSGDTSKTFTFIATGDEIDDDGEGVKLEFGIMPDPRVSTGSEDETTISITDDDTADIVLNPTPLTVIEEDASAYTVALATEPTVNVTVTISGHAGTDLSLESVKLTGDVLTFTPANWDTPQAVTVRAAHDDDGAPEAESLTHTAAGAEYAGVTKALPVTVNDNDPLGISIDPPQLTVEESRSVDYTVSLDTEPTVPVTVTISGHTGTDLTIRGSTLVNDTLTFTATNWNIPQTVTVKAVHDEDRDDETWTLTDTADGGEYQGLMEMLRVNVDDTTGDLRLVGGQLTDPGNNGDLSEGRLEILYDGEWCTICDDYWNSDDADVACRHLGFVGGSIYDVRTAVDAGFPAGADGQRILLDDLRCDGDESGLLECRHRGVGSHNCKHFEDVGLRCVQNSVGPYVTGMVISGPPGGNSLYDVGETVTVTVTWSEAVNVDLTPTDGNYPPRLGLSYGTRSRGAPATRAWYTSGSGTVTTVFTGTVEDRGNAPYARIDVSPEVLTTEIWNSTPGQDPVGSHITSVATGKPAMLKHGLFLGPESGQQVEATSITGAPAFNDPGDDGVFGPGETVEVTFAFSRLVQVDTTGGTPSVPVLLGGTAARDAPYLRGSGSGLLVFGYTLVDGDGEHSSLLVDPDTLALNGGAIRDAADNLDADISHQGGGSIYFPAVESDTTAPQLQSATVDGSSLTLTFDEELDNSNPLSSGLFTVYVNGWARSVPAVAVGQTNVVLSLSPAVVASDVVTVDYTVPTDAAAGRVQDASGNAADLLQRADGHQRYRLTGYEQIGSGAGARLPAGGPPRERQAPGIMGRPRYRTRAHGLHGAVEGVRRRLGRRGRRVGGRCEGRHLRDHRTDRRRRVRRPGRRPERRRRERPLGGGHSHAAGDGPAGSLVGIGGRGHPDSHFSEALDAGRAPDESAFAVTVAGGDRDVDAVAVSGSDVTLTLATAVSSGETVTVDYTAPAGESESRLQDLAGNAAASFSGEAVTNDTPAPVLLTASALDVPSSHDGSTTFIFELRFSENTPLDWKTLRDHAFTVTGGEVMNARRFERDSSTPNIRWEISVTPSGNADVTVVLPATTDCDAQGAICADDGRKLSVDVTVNVPGPGEEDTPPAQELSLSDFEAGDGQTVLTGTLIRVGERGRKNDETLDRAWYATDASDWYASGELLDGSLVWNDMTLNRVVYFPATGVLRFNEADPIHFGESFAAGDVSRELTMWVRTETGAVSFLARDHLLKSGGNFIDFRALEANRPALNAIAKDDLIIIAVSATGYPTITGTAQVGQTLTADTSGISDDEGVTNAAFTYQWLADDADISGATGSSYTLADADEGKTIKVRVSFTDDAGNDESLTRAPTTAVTAAPDG